MINIVDKNKSPLCCCGKPRKKVFFVHLDKYIHSTWCDDCEIIAGKEAVQRERTEKDNIIRRAIKRELDPLYYKASMSDFSKDIRDLLLDKPDKQGILIWGKTGTGKSHLASAIVKDYLMAGKRAKMVRFKDMVLKIRASYNENHTEESILRPYINCHFLSIEDIGTIRSGRVESDFCKDTLLTVVDARLQKELPTGITTNLSPEAIWKAFGERLASRFSTFLIFKLEGRDRRKDQKTLKESEGEI